MKPAGEILRIAVCDDEAPMRRQLVEQLGAFWRQVGRPAEVRAFAGAEALLQQLAWQPQVICLDIKMPPPDGLTAAKELRRQGFDGFLIFVTVLRELVFQSFEVQPFDYLLKPLQPEALAQTLNRLRQSLESRENQEPDQLLVQKGQERLLVPLQQLVYCEVLGRKVYLHLQWPDGKTEIIDFYERLEKLQSRLGERFFRCHRSYLVNLAYVRGCSGGRLRLAQGEEIPVSRLREAELRQALLVAMQKRSGNGLV